ncbi:MAG TPA: glycosyltransferase family 2 protein [Tepidisphaeraceae bacterium]
MNPATETASPSPTSKTPVTVVVPTLNEAKNLPKCLDHLQWADEVVVVDSGSTDGTQDIARSKGARVIDFRWNGQWPKKRGWTLEHAELKHPWILFVDADEWIVADLADEIGAAIRSDAHVAYWINRRFIFMNRWIKHCGYYPSWNLRLLKRGYGEFERLTDVGDTRSGDNEVHEHILVNGPSGRLTKDMLHFAFPNIETWVEKHNRYSNWEAIVQHHARPGDGSVAANKDIAGRRRLKMLARHLPFRPTLRFIYSYVLRGGFLDGRAGFTLCRLIGIYEFLSVSKLYELRHQAETAREFESPRSA